MIEIDEVAQTKKIQEELAQMENQLALIDRQLLLWDQRKRAITSEILKMNGKLELLQNLNNSEQKTAAKNIKGLPGAG